ncbi:hypothetical protein FI667_g4378, partial [Globisporangium splendens]
MEDYIRGIVCGCLIVQHGVKADAKRNRMFLVLLDSRIDYYVTDPRPKFEQKIANAYMFTPATRLHYYVELNARAPPLPPPPRTARRARNGGQGNVLAAQGDLDARGVRAHAAADKVQVEAASFVSEDEGVEFLKQHRILVSYATGQAHLILAAPGEHVRSDWVTAIRMRIISLKYRHNRENKKKEANGDDAYQLRGFMDVQIKSGEPWKKSERAQSRLQVRDAADPDVPRRINSHHGQRVRAAQSGSRDLARTRFDQGD